MKKPDQDTARPASRGRSCTAPAWPHGWWMPWPSTYTYAAAWEWTGDPGQSNLHKEDLDFQFVKPTQRSYK